jgi:ABC-2 type transport system permease protein
VILETQMLTHRFGALTALSLIVACLVKMRERFMGIGRVLTMPFFFVSNAIYLISIMPGWLQVTLYANPLAYEVDVLRTLMLADGTGVNGLELNFSILVVIGGRLYPNVAI